MQPVLSPYLAVPFVMSGIDPVFADRPQNLNLHRYGLRALCSCGKAFSWAHHRLVHIVVFAEGNCMGAKFVSLLMVSGGSSADPRAVKIHSPEECAGPLLG